MDGLKTTGSFAEAGARMKPRRDDGQGRRTGPRAARAMAHLYRFVHRKHRSRKSGMLFGNPRNKYAQEYALIEIERDGGLYAQRETFGDR